MMLPLLMREVVNRLGLSRAFTPALGASSSLRVEILEILRHLLDLGVVVILNLSDELGVVGRHEVDGDTLSTETTGSTNSMNVVLLLEGQLVVDDETNLLHIDTSGEQIGGDEHTSGGSSELLHDGVSLDLVHLTVHGGNGELVLSHALFELEDSLLGVAIDEGLVDFQTSVQVEKNLNLPLLLVDSDVVLRDTLKSEMLLLDEDLLGVAHEVLSQGQDLVGHGSREQSNLNVSGQELEDVLNLLLETAREHLIGLVHDEDTQVVRLEDVSLHHIVDTAGRTNDDVNTALQLLDVLLDTGATNASVNVDARVLTDGLDDEGNLHRELTGRRNDEALNERGRTVDDLESGDGEGTRLTSTGLGLSNGVVTLDNWQDTLLLDWGGLRETVAIDTSKDLFLQSHMIKQINFFIPIWLQVLAIFFFLGLLFSVGSDFLLLIFSRSELLFVFGWFHG